MRRLLLVASVVSALLALLVIYGGSRVRLAVSTADAQKAVPSDSIIRLLPNDAFGLGERLKFSIGYGFVTAGYASLEVEDTMSINDVLCYRILSQTNSNSFFDKFYKVRDTIVSCLDVDGLFSHYFFKALHEGSYHSNRQIDFDYQQRRAIYRKGGSTIDTIPVWSFTQDVLSVLYYVRTIPLEIGRSVFIPSISGDSCSQLEVRVIEREKVEVPAGEFSCIVVEPLLTAAGIFKNEGQIKVWLTDDRLRLPVLMKSRVLVGSIFAELEEYHLGDMNW